MKKKIFDTFFSPRLAVSKCEIAIPVRFKATQDGGLGIVVQWCQKQKTFHKVSQHSALVL